MMQVAELMNQYGYFAVFFGVMIEGESVLLAAAYAIHQHYLHVWPVVLTAASGAALSDHVYFYLGRHQGAGWLARHDNVRKRAERVQNLVYQHQTLLLMFFRFMVGFRTITPLLLGMAGVARWRFFVFDVVASLLWATLITFAGNWLLKQLHDLRVYERLSENHMIIGLLLLASLIGAAHLWWMRRKRQRSTPKSPTI
jgi:membrane protein DedA with SNARE-associated domain